MIRLVASIAPNSAPVGWPSGWAVPAAHGTRATGDQAVPSTGPENSIPSGPSRYPRLPVSTIDAEPGPPGPVSPEVDAPTGVQSSAPAGEEYSVNLVHWAANAGPLPVHEANTANARSPTVSRSVTRSPPVFTWV